MKVASSESGRASTAPFNDRYGSLIILAI